MELIDKCVHCGNPKDEHGRWESWTTMTFVYTGECDNPGRTEFKSITVAAAEKNAVMNLELLIEVHEKIGDLPFSNSTLSFPLLRHRIEQAIEDSTPKE